MEAEVSIRRSRVVSGNCETAVMLLFAFGRANFMQRYTIRIILSSSGKPTAVEIARKNARFQPPI